MRHRFPKSSQHPDWKGGVTYYNGRKAILTPGHPFAYTKNGRKSGYVFESRLIMEKEIGRYLLRHEKVHHINGDITDNRLENLIVLTNKAHMRYHHNPKAKWNLVDDPNWLIDQYLNKNKTVIEIAKELNCSKTTICEALIRFCIKKTPYSRYEIRFPQLQDKDWLANQRKTMSYDQIAKSIGCCGSTVVKYSKRFKLS